MLLCPVLVYFYIEVLGTQQNAYTFNVFVCGIGTYAICDMFDYYMNVNAYNHKYGELIVLCLI